MKNILLSMAVLIFVSVTVSFQSEAQQTSSVSKSNNDEESSWSPAKINSDGTNLLDGVEFYKKTISTAMKALIIVKVVNTNSYAVKIQWEESAGVITEMIIPANSSAEGNADSVNKDSNESKLVLPKTLTDEAKRLMLSTISVTQVK